ncbi:MAG: pilus assembly protein Flp/PilA [Candidatus Aldehydirespiratoraceae bacterium]|jgi:pilus assembly protein Flp/PilA
MQTIATIHTRILNRAKNDRGVSLVEYALLIALLAMVCIAAVSALGETTSQSFSEAVSELS